MRAKKIKIGIALSGGGALGAAHLGVLHALEEEGIKPYHITGISAGAIIGSLYCSGNKPKEILDYFELDSLMELVKFSGFGSGIIDTDYFQKIIIENTKTDDFSKLKVKLTIGATNLNTGCFEVFTKGQLSKIAGASSAVPLLMKPVTINGQDYVDGGLVNNLLVDPLIESCDFIIGINAHFHKQLDDISGVKEVAKRCFEIIAGSSVTQHGKKCDFFFEVKETSNYALFDFKHSKELFDIGYKEIKAEINNIKTAIEEKAEMLD